MTPAERRRPDIIKASRRRRIALGSGTSTAEVNRLLKQFTEMQRMMKMISAGKMPRAGGGLGALLGR
jgi:signal recognition particle subunit SRP54